MLPYEKKKFVKPKANKKFNCSYCDEVFQDLGTLMDHEEKHELEFEEAERNAQETFKQNIPYSQKQQITETNEENS